MMQVLAEMLISIIEKEIVNHKPEIEAYILSQVEYFGQALLDYVSGKTEATVASPEKKDE